MNPVISVIIFFIAVAILIQSGSVVVSRLSRIARFFQISEFTASFVLIAFATSLPDFFIGVSAALHDNPVLSFSNIIGANIATLTLAAGVAVVLARGLRVPRKIVRRSAIYAGFAAFLPVLLFLDGEISRVDGVVLIFFMGWYFIKLLFQRGRFTKIFSNLNNDLFNIRQFLKDLAVLAIAVVVLVASADVVTRSALAVASGFGVSVSIIGILFVALSITLPEIVFGVRAVMMGHKGMVLGNLIGSVIINSGLVIGATALIAPIQVQSFSPFIIGIIFTALVAFMFALFAHTNKKISVPEGFMLISVYAVFVVLLFVFNGGVV